MNVALKSIIKLTVRVSYELRDKSFKQFCPSLPSLQARCPASFSQIPRAVCRILAPALPVLRALHVEGCCEDAAFKAFGTSCPNLTHVQVDPTILPPAALDDMAASLSRMACLTFKSKRRPSTARPLEAYMKEALLALQGCTSLSKLVFDFHRDITLVCDSEHWGQIPESVKELVSHCSLLSVESAQPFIAGLHTLCIHGHIIGLHILRILPAAPNLRKLLLAQNQSMHMHNVDPGVTLLKERIHQGLNFVVPGVELCEAGVMMHVILSALPVLLNVRTCTLEFRSTEAPHISIQLARVFPNLADLNLISRNRQSYPGLVMQQLSFLTACKALKLLRISRQLSLTTHEMVNLRKEIPNLEIVVFK